LRNDKDQRQAKKRLLLVTRKKRNRLFIRAVPVSAPLLIEKAAARDPGAHFPQRASRFSFPRAKQKCDPAWRRDGAATTRVRQGEAMNEDKVNMEVRRFLKAVGVSSQREIQNAIAAAVKSGVIQGNAKLKAKMTLQVDAVQLTHVVEGEIALD
jgi:Family of unknown function (DUF6494)